MVAGERAAVEVKVDQGKSHLRCYKARKPDSEKGRFT
jgi:hypothetical protein